MTRGAMKNGSIIIGFIMIGKPNVTVSLMLNNPGAIDKRPMYWICCDLAKKAIMKAKDKVAPDPP